MARKRTWVVALVGGVVAIAVILLWSASELSKCSYAESSPSYSEEKKFYFQMKFTTCHDAAKSHASLIMGQAGKEGKSVLLDFGSSMDTVNASWREGPELHVQVPESAITKRYGPYEDLP